MYLISLAGISRSHQQSGGNLAGEAGERLGSLMVP
jgi:hypothetical protein